MARGRGTEVSERDNTAAARQTVGANPVWYHTIELAPGVVTPGYVDMRPVAGRLLPDDMGGMRALDIGTFDGFWAFEMERRGAREVVAIDVEQIDDAEWPPHKREQLKRDVDARGVELGRGFSLAADALESSVRRVVCNVYDLEPERIGGPVNLAFSGTILLHLRDPVRGLERIRSVLAPGGELRLIEPFSVALTLRAPRTPAARFSTLDTPFNWWLPNLATLDAWLRTAGFERIRRLGIVRPPARREMRQPYVGLAYRPAG
jgi:SAM-dependent methyltransferase